MHMQRMNSKCEYVNMQYRQITATTTTNNHHIYTDMQNIIIVGGEFRMYPKVLEKSTNT